MNEASKTQHKVSPVFIIVSMYVMCMLRLCACNVVYIYKKSYLTDFTYYINILKNKYKYISIIYIFKGL